VGFWTKILDDAGSILVHHSAFGSLCMVSSSTTQVHIIQLAYILQHNPTPHINNFSYKNSFTIFHIPHCSSQVVVTRPVVRKYGRRVERDVSALSSLLQHLRFYQCQFRGQDPFQKPPPPKSHDILGN